MRVEAIDKGSVRTPYLVRDRAAWTLRSRKAVGCYDGNVFEIAIGSGALDRGTREGNSVDCYGLALSDEEMVLLAQAEARTAPLPRLAEAMALVVKRGLPVGLAAEVFGLARGDATRLGQVNELDDSVKSLLAAQGRTLNHARWILGLKAEVAKAGLKIPGKSKRSKYNSVADLRTWREKLDQRSKSQREQKAGPDPTLVAALATETDRLQGHLGADVLLEAGENGQRHLRVGYSTVESLQGVMLKMLTGHGDAPPYPDGGPWRYLTFSGLTDEELAFLTGNEDS